MAKHSFNTLMRRLSRAGFKQQFVAAALMPEWWEESYSHDPTVLPEVEVRVARFLNVPLAEVKNADVSLMPPSYGRAQLRRVGDIDRNRLGPAIHAAMQVARAVVRNMRSARPVDTSIDDALRWRQLLKSGEGTSVQLEDILGNLWAKGIPVVPLNILPTPNFQGLACVVDERPVIVLGHRYDEPGRVAYIVAHEAGHIAAGDCSADVPVLDRDEAIRDDSDMERAADCFAKCLLVGQEDVAIPEGADVDAKGLAQQAVNLERQTGADASLIIFSWAARTLNYAAATMAVKALYRSVGARRKVRNLFDQYVDLDSAAESDRALLRCLDGEPQPTTVAG